MIIVRADQQIFRSIVLFVPIYMMNNFCIWIACPIVVQCATNSALSNHNMLVFPSLWRPNNNISMA